MLYLAQIINHSCLSEQQLYLLACKKSDHVWEGCSELIPFSAQLDYSVKPNTTMFRANASKNDTDTRTL
jgi:hypothetical protein